MEKALVVHAGITVVQNGGIVDVAGAGDVTIVAFGHNTFKLQGSYQGGAYADLAGTAQTSDTTIALPTSVSVFQAQAVDHLKVVIDSGYAVVLRHNRRSSPQAPSFAMSAKSIKVIDPQFGTA